MITNRQKNFLVFYISQSLFFGLGYQILFKITGNDTYLSCLLGSLLGILFCMIYKKIFKPIKLLLNICILFLSIYLIINFIKTFFLINSSYILIILPIIFLIIYIFNKDYILISRLVECLFPITFTIIIITIISLIFKSDFTNIKPILSHQPLSIIKSAIIYFLLTAMPLILLSDFNFKDSNIINNYLFSSLILLIISVIIIGVLGPNLINIYKYPEYIILKEINIFNFFKKLENILVIPWIINLFIVLFISLLNIKKIGINTNFLKKRT